MGKVTPTNESVLALKGLHLYHSGVSNCSMRVRMTLAEKDLDWTSHHLNILQKERLTEDYFGINPNGLVPTLVHDGTVIIESDNIIDYLDEQFPKPPLKPENEDSGSVMYEWLHRSTGIHLSAVKPYIYHHRVGKRQCFKSMDETLDQSEWLAGGYFSLADIAWIPVQYVLQKMTQYDFSGYRHVSEWADRLAKRLSYASGILDWWPQEMQREDA